MQTRLFHSYIFMLVYICQSLPFLCVFFCLKRKENFVAFRASSIHRRKKYILLFKFEQKLAFYFNMLIN